MYFLRLNITNVSSVLGFHEIFCLLTVERGKGREKVFRLNWGPCQHWPGAQPVETWNMARKMAIGASWEFQDSSVPQIPWSDSPPGQHQPAEPLRGDAARGPCAHMSQTLPCAEQFYAPFLVPGGMIAVCKAAHGLWSLCSVPYDLASVHMPAGLLEETILL